MITSSLCFLRRSSTDKKGGGEERALFSLRSQKSRVVTKAFYFFGDSQCNYDFFYPPLELATDKQTQSRPFSVSISALG